MQPQGCIKNSGLNNGQTHIWFKFVLNIIESVLANIQQQTSMAQTGSCNQTPKISLSTKLWQTLLLSDTIYHIQWRDLCLLVYIEPARKWETQRWPKPCGQTPPQTHPESFYSSHHCCSGWVFFVSELVKRRAGYFHHELLVLTTNLKTSLHIIIYTSTWKLMLEQACSLRLRRSWVNLTSTHWSHWFVCHPEGKTLYRWFTIKHELIVCRPYNLNE